MVWWRTGAGEREPAAGDDYALPSGHGRAAGHETILTLEVPKPQPGEPPRRRRRWLSWKWRLAIWLPIYLVAALAVTVGAMFVYYTMVWPDPHALRHKERSPIVRVLARDGSVLAERGTPHDYMPLDLLPDHVRNAVLATEDHRFYEHVGLDPIGLLRAGFANLRAGRYAQGGSTLTQQLAKNLFLSSERTLERKLEELLLALWLEIRLTKDEILELYLNRVYFGAGAYGIEAAARRYFDRSARELSLGEAALIAGLLKAPSRYSPFSSPGAARARGRVVLQRMQTAGLITPAELAATRLERIRFAEHKPAREASGVEYAVDFVLERLPPLVGTGYAEIIVETTIDPALQRRAQAVVHEAITRARNEVAASQAAMAVIDRDGGIVALVGGRSYLDSQFNRAVKARRQPGSAFKTFLYLAALEAGLTPDTPLLDAPLTIEGWSPRNDNGQHLGMVSMRQAVSRSINTVAARVQSAIGAGPVIAVARRLGIEGELQATPSLALGTSEISLLQLTGAYGVLASGGVLVQPHTIRRVRLGSGRVIYARKPPRTRPVIEADHVADMNEMLAHAVASGTGRRAMLDRHPTAGKTGTTQDHRDAWFVGFTSHLTGGVWVGNDNGRPMDRVMGGNLPAEIWREVMTFAHEGRQALPLPGLEGQRARALPLAWREPAGDSHGGGTAVVSRPATRKPLSRGVRGDQMAAPAGSGQMPAGTRSAAVAEPPDTVPRNASAVDAIGLLLAREANVDGDRAVPQAVPEPPTLPLPSSRPPAGMMSLGAGTGPTRQP